MLDALFPSTLDAIPEQFRVDAAKNPARYLLGGEVVTLARDDQRLPIYSKIALVEGGKIEPILIGWTPIVGAREAQRAAESAARAWEDPIEAQRWRHAPWEVRIAAIEKFAAALARRTEEIAVLLMYEIGKPYADAKKEVTRSVEYIENTIVELRALLAAADVPYSGVNGKTTHHAVNVVQPSGVVLCVGPFNYPINELYTMVVPALLMGNPVVVKTPRFGVLANQVLMEDLAAIFPRGVISVLPGDGKAVIPDVIAAKTVDVFGKTSARVKTLAFIGTEGAAHAIASHHPAPSFLTRILGLGAKNPAVILRGATLSDADLAKLVKGALGNSGQRCTAEKIIFVPDGAEGDVLVSRIAAAVSALEVGMPWAPNAAICPLPEDQKVEAMRAYVDDAVSKGARLVVPWASFHSLMRPVVLDRVVWGMKIYFEEQFGPVVPIARYSHVSEALTWERISPFGQQAGVWGPAGAEKEALCAGFVGEVARLNIDDVCQRGPDGFGFTATEKSGYGTLSLRDALLAFSRASIVQSPAGEEVLGWARRKK